MKRRNSFLPSTRMNGWRTMRAGVTVRRAAVSYTHLDVYKRQEWTYVIIGVAVAAAVGVAAIKALEWLVKKDKFQFFGYRSIQKNNQRNTGIRLIVGAIVPAKGRRQTENQ